MQAWWPDGKRSGCRELNAFGGGMIFMQDDESKQKFLVDTGAAFRVLPHCSLSTPSGPPISGADKKRHSLLGTIHRRLTFGPRTFLVTLLLATVSRPILRLDFLSTHRLVNPVSRQVLDLKSFELRNTTHTFEPFMNRLFKHLPFVFTYLAEHIIASRTLQEHYDHLRQFFTILQENGLQVNSAKCAFAA
jgi:hypothetical protein